MAKYTYSVVLSNKDCIFDSSPIFDTATEAVEWAIGRGGSHVAQFSREKNGEYDYDVSVSVNGDGSYSYYLVWEWCDVPADKLVDLIDGAWLPTGNNIWDD